MTSGSSSSGRPVGRVVVIGSMNLDHVARVDRLPPAGATILAGSYRTAPGGKGLNQAVSAARQGAPTVMVAARGRDGAGAELLEVLDHEGIDHARVAVRPGVATGVALITVAEDGTNVIVVAAGANGTVDAGQFADFDWAPGDVALCQLEIPYPTVEAALGAARAGGAVTVLNPAPASGPLAPSLLSLVDVLVPNEGEAATLASRPAGGDPAEAARVLAGQSGGTVIVTLGEAGSVVVGPGGDLTPVPAFPVRPVDTTAAGDAYCGALAAALAAGAELPAAVRRASAAGSLATTREGAVPSIPTAAEVDGMLAG